MVVNLYTVKRIIVEIQTDLQIVPSESAGHCAASGSQPSLPTRIIGGAFRKVASLCPGQASQESQLCSHKRPCLDLILCCCCPEILIILRVLLTSPLYWSSQIIRPIQAGGQSHHYQIRIWGRGVDERSSGINVTICFQCKGWSAVCLQNFTQWNTLILRVCFEYWQIFPNDFYI